MFHCLFLSNGQLKKRKLSQRTWWPKSLDVMQMTYCLIQTNYLQTKGFLMRWIQICLWIPNGISDGLRQQASGR